MEWTIRLDAQELWANFILPWGTHILLALLIFIVGRLLAATISRTVTKALIRARVDPILTGFLGTLTYATLVLLVVVFALSHLGLDTTSLVALVGAAGLALGLALKDSLSHFAAGVMLIVFRPFKIGDYVEVSGVAGSVNRITIYSTRLRTPDNKVVTIPNGKVFGNTILNYSEESTRRIDLVVNIGYGSNLLTAKTILEAIIKDHDKILRDPAHRIAVSELGSSAVSLIVRPWVNSADYWDVRFQLLETIKLRFEAKGIEIPFPQMDIHMKNTATEPSLTSNGGRSF